jgi:serine/threonine protein kinase
MAPTHPMSTGTRQAHSAAPVVPGFELVRLLSSGSYSDVWLARADHLQHFAAVKIYHRTLNDGATRARFLAEAANAGRLTDLDEVASTYRSDFTAHGAPFLAMDYFDAGSLQDAINEGSSHTLGRPLSSDELIAVARFLTAALQCIHDRNVLHLDLKPANVLLRRDGRLGLTDFGISRPQSGGTDGDPILTPEFAAPELWHGNEPTTATDVYGLCATLHCLGVGMPPFTQRAAEPLADYWARSIAGKPPTLGRTDLPDDLVSLVAAGLSHDSTHRPALSDIAGALPTTTANESRQTLTGLARRGPGKEQWDSQPRATPAVPQEEYPRPPELAAAGPEATPTDYGTRHVHVETAPSIDPTQVVSAKSKRTSLIVALILVLVGIAGAGWWLLRPSAPTEGVPTSQLLSLRPTSVAVTTISGSAQVSWRDHADHIYPWVVAYQSDTSFDPVYEFSDAQTRSASTAIVSNIAANGRYCFRVGIVVAGSDVQTVWSDESACLNGALPPNGWPKEVSN